MSLFSILGFVVGTAALGLAIYSRYKQKEAEKRQIKAEERQERIEERLEQKEKLRELAHDLDEVIEWIEEFHQGLSNWPKYDNIPYYSDYATVWGSLIHISKDVLGYHHYTDENPRISVSVVHWKEEDNKIPIESGEEGVALYEKAESPTIILKLEDEAGYADETVFCHINEIFTGAGKFKYRSGIIEEKHADLIDEFAPNLFDQLDSQISKILANILDQSISVEPGFQINPDRYDRVDEIAEGIFKMTVVYDGIESDLHELDDLLEELRDTRDSIVQTSFS